MAGIKPADGDHLVIGEHEIEHIHVLYHAFLVDRLGDDYNSLLDEEAQTVVSTLIRDYYDVLEGSDYKSKAVSDYSLTLAGTYGMSFSVHMLASAAEIGAVLFPLDAAMPAFGSPCN